MDILKLEDIDLEEKDIKNIISMYAKEINNKIDNVNKFVIPNENPVLPTEEGPAGNNSNPNATQSPYYNPNSPESDPFAASNYAQEEDPFAASNYAEEEDPFGATEYAPISPEFSPVSPEFSEDSPIIVQGEELPTGSQVLPTGEIVLPPKQSLNIPFIPASLDNQNTLVNSDLKPESKEVTFAEPEPQSSILNVDEAKEDKSKDSNNDNKDNSSSSSNSIDNSTSTGPLLADVKLYEITQAFNMSDQDDTSYYNLEACKAIFKSLPDHSKANVNNLYHQTSARLGRAATFAELSRAMNLYRSTIDQDIRQYSGENSFKNKRAPHINKTSHLRPKYTSFVVTTNNPWHYIDTEQFGAVNTQKLARARTAMKKGSA